MILAVVFQPTHFILAIVVYTGLDYLCKEEGEMTSQEFLK